MMDWVDHMNLCEGELEQMNREGETLYGGDSMDYHEEGAEMATSMTFGNILEITIANVVVRVVDESGWIEKIAPRNTYPSLLDREVIYITVEDNHLVLEVKKKEGDSWWEEAELA